MKHLLLLIFSLLNFMSPTPGCAQKQNTDTLNLTSEEGKRTGLWIFYFENGNKKEEGNYLNGIKEGLWTNYYQNGNKKNEITFSDGIARGRARFYYENGVLWEEGFWNQTHWTGPYHFFHPNGEKAYDWNYNNQGRRTGIQKYFHPNGKIKYKGTWEDGKVSSNVEVFNEKGILTATRQYNNGNFNKKVVDETPPKKSHKEVPEKSLSPFQGTGYHTIYHLNGRIEKKGYFRNGQLYNGHHYLYNPEDSIIEIRIFEKGKLISQKEKNTLPQSPSQ